MSQNNPVVVIGSGIVGLSTAIWLVRYGVQVRVIERHAIAEPSATSCGNAGVLAACSVAPVTAPGLIGKGLKLLLDPNFPLFLRWSYLFRLFPWLVRYLSHANDKDTRRIASALMPLVFDSVEQHQALVKGTPAEAWLQQSQYGFVYHSAKEFKNDWYTWLLRAQAGFKPEIIEGEGVRAFEPALAPDLRFMALMSDHGFVQSPQNYLCALQKVAKAEGVKFTQAEVKDFEMHNNRVGAVLTTEGKFACHQVVITAGVWSKFLAKKLKLHVPLESERGYHIEFSEPNQMPKIPLMITSGKFVATPMANGLRCAGVVEFGGLNAPASEPPIALLRKKVKATFPNFEAKGETTWLGHRPAPSDSLPLIGEIQNTGVFAGFGHHHIGLTSGPKTGRILAGLITGKPEKIDLAPYLPSRFGGKLS